MDPSPSVAGRSKVVRKDSKSLVDTNVLQRLAVPRITVRRWSRTWKLIEVRMMKAKEKLEDLQVA